MTKKLISENDLAYLVEAQIKHWNKHKPRPLKYPKLTYFIVTLLIINLLVCLILLPVTLIVSLIAFIFITLPIYWIKSKNEKRKEKAEPKETKESFKTEEA